MKESIGNAMLFYLVITFVIILIAFFVGSLSYTKAYKVKNKIVEEIEKERTYNDSVQKEIESWLKSGDNGSGIGYRINTGAHRCNSYNGTNSINKSSNYEYCVYELTTCNSNNDAKCGTYYRVTTYMYFDLPVIGDLIKIPISGETMTFVEINS